MGGWQNTVAISAVIIAFFAYNAYEKHIELENARVENARNEIDNKTMKRLVEALEEIAISTVNKLIEANEENNKTINELIEVIEKRTLYIKKEENNERD